MCCAWRGFSNHFLHMGSSSNLNQNNSRKLHHLYIIEPLCSWLSTKKQFQSWKPNYYNDDHIHSIPIANMTVLVLELCFSVGKFQLLVVALSDASIYCFQMFNILGVVNQWMSKKKVFSSHWIRFSTLGHPWNPLGGHDMGWGHWEMEAEDDVLALGVFHPIVLREFKILAVARLLFVFVIREIIWMQWYEAFIMKEMPTILVVVALGLARSTATTNVTPKIVKEGTSTLAIPNEEAYWKSLAIIADPNVGTDAIACQSDLRFQNNVSSGPFKPKHHDASTCIQLGLMTYNHAKINLNVYEFLWK